MSYILDALRRADAERERGAVPDLHAQPMSAPVGDGEPPTGALPWPAIAIGLALLLLLVLAWQWWGSDAPAATPAAPVALAASPPVAAAPPPVVETPVAPRAPAAVSLPLPPPEQPLRLPAPAPVAKATAQPEAAPAASTAAPAAATAERLYALHELPEAIRLELPRLAIGGSVYSSNPAARVLIVNGQVFQEGGQPGPELVLEQIGLKSAVMRYKGYRYEIGY